MWNIVDDIEARNIQFVQEVDSLWLLFAENSNQHIGSGHLGLVRGLYVKNGPLQDTLESQCRLRLPGVAFQEFWCGFFQEFANIFLELIQISPAGA